MNPPNFAPGPGFSREPCHRYRQMPDAFNSGWIDFGVPGMEDVAGLVPIEDVLRSLTGRVGNQKTNGQN